MKWMHELIPTKISLINEHYYHLMQAVLLYMQNLKYYMRHVNSYWQIAQKIQGIYKIVQDIYLHVKNAEHRFWQHRIQGIAKFF